MKSGFDDDNDNHYDQDEEVYVADEYAKAIMRTTVMISCIIKIKLYLHY